MNTLEIKTNEETETLEEVFKELKYGYTIQYVLYRHHIDDRDAYSIQVIEYIEGERVCQSTAYDVSSIEASARKICKKLSDGLVTPVVLHEVIYDLLL